MINTKEFAMDMTVRNTAQFRQLFAEVQSLKQEVANLSVAQAVTSQVIPPLVNFVDNSDFIFSDEAYNATAYTDDEDVLAQWLARAQATATSWVPNSASESAESIRSSAHGSGARATAEWDTAKGVIAMTGGYKVATKLPSKVCAAGNYLACRIQMTRVDGTSIGAGVKLKVSIWDNTDNRILRGDYPTLTSTKQGLHSGGTVTRQYILEVLMPDGRTFYSDTTSFTTGQNQVVNSVAATSIDATNYVNIAIPKIVGASRYNIYRRTPSEADTNWYLVDSVPVSTNQVSDFGGSGGRNAWTVPAFDNEHRQYQVAEAIIDDLDEEVAETESPTEVIVGIQIPTNFVINGDQYLQIEFLKSDYTATTTTEIPADSVLIDKIGLSYTNGRWIASSRDQTKLPTPTTPTDPIPSGGGGSSDGGVGVENPEGGGGTCVHKDSLILAEIGGNRVWIPARSIAVGDHLVTWDGEKFVPSRVRKVIRGFSRLNYKLSIGDQFLVCSYSHKVIKDFDDFEKGTRVGKLDNHILTYENGVFKKSEIEGFECFEQLIEVVTFKMDKNENYIANGFACHNLKPLEDYMRAVIMY